MFERIASFLKGLGPEATQEGGFASDDPRLAAAALMYHVMGADGVVQASEQNRLASVLKDAYDLDKAELERLLEAARDADNEAVDLYQFTSVLMRKLEATERLKFIELLWEIVYADGENHELEDNLVWRISELLGIDGRDRVLMRQAVQARVMEAGDGAS